MIETIVWEEKHGEIRGTIGEQSIGNFYKMKPNKTSNNENLGRWMWNSDLYISFTFDEMQQIVCKQKELEY